jgi:hypothetical protein
MFRGAWGLPSCMLVRRETMERLRFDPTLAFGEDTDFLYRFHRAGFACFEHPEVLTVYRRHAADSQARRTDQARLTSIRVLETYLADSPFPDKTRQEIERRKARYLAKHRRWKEARPHCWAWLRSRPTSRGAWWHFLRSLIG